MDAVVIPVFNEEKTVKKIIKSVSSYCDLIIVVNDASTDNTLEILNQIKNNKLFIINNKKNLGIGGATKKGILKGQELGALFIIKFDGDGQHLESDIPKLLHLLKNNKFDFVKGNRFIGSYSDMPMIRVFANLITTNLQKIVTGNYKISDPNNGLIGFNSMILERINIRYLRNDYFFENSFLLIANIFKLKIAEFSMKTIYGDEKSSVSLIRGSLKVVPVFIKMLYLKNYLNAKHNLSMSSLIFYVINILTVLKVTNLYELELTVIIFSICIYFIIDVLNFLNE